MDVEFSIHDGLHELASATLARIEGPVVAVSGGSTYEKLFPHWRGEKIQRCLWMPVDERRVGLSEEGSNWMKAIHLLLDPNGLHEHATHWSHTSEGLADIALGLAGTGPEGVPVLDQIWLGMGEDGHTASIFPGGKEMDDLRSISLLTTAPKSPRARVTLGLSVLRAARNLCVVILGEDKGAMLRRVLDGDQALPLTRALADRESTIFLDRACAQAAGVA